MLLKLSFMWECYPNQPETRMMVKMAMDSTKIRGE